MASVNWKPGLTKFLPVELQCEVFTAQTSAVAVVAQ